MPSSLIARSQLRSVFLLTCGIASRSHASDSISPAFQRTEKISIPRVFGSPGGFGKHPVQEEECGLRLGAGLAVPGKPGRKRQGNGGGSLDRDRRKRGNLRGNGEAGIFRHGVDEPLAPAPASGAGTGLPAFTFRKVENRAFGKP